MDGPAYYLGCGMRRALTQTLGSTKLFGQAMKKIIKDFIEGDSTKKLSIVSDFVSILGVSVATVVAGPFLSKFASIEFDLGDFVIAIAFYFICFWLLGEVAYFFISKIYRAVLGGQYRTTAVLALTLAVFTWFVAVSFPSIRYASGYVFNCSYLLAPKPLAGIKGITYKISPISDEINEIEVNAKFSDGIHSSDYVAVIYKKNDNMLYEVASYGKSFPEQYLAQFNSKGSAIFPLSVETLQGRSPVVVIFRKADRSIFHSMRGSGGFPSQLVQVRDPQLEEMGAYIVPVEPNHSLQARRP